MKRQSTIKNNKTQINKNNNINITLFCGEKATKECTRFFHFTKLIDCSSEMSCCV